MTTRRRLTTFFLLLLILPLAAYPQKLLVASPTVIRANFSTVFTSITASPVSTIQFSFQLIPGQIASVTPTPGSASITAGKFAECGPLNNTSSLVETLTCIVSGTNTTTAIPTGTIVNFSVTVAPNTTLPSIQIIPALPSAVSVTSGMMGAIPAPSPDGTRTIFQLPSVPVANTLILSIDGGYQNQGTDYTLSGSSITFLVAPSQGSTILGYFTPTPTPTP